jgi:hypothetical protein
MTEAELRAWDPDLVGVIAYEPCGVLPQHMEEALPPGLAAQWLPDAERRGLVKRIGDHRWTLTQRGRELAGPQQFSIEVGLPDDRAQRDSD